MKKLISFVITLVLIIGLMLCGSVAVFADTGQDVAAVADVINSLAVFAGVVLSVLGMLTVFVQIITQVTKWVPPINRVPTKLWVIIVSLIVCELALFIGSSMAGITVLWYYIVMAVFMAMTVAYISINGWDALKELYDRYMIRKLKT